MCKKCQRKNAVILFLVMVATVAVATAQSAYQRSTSAFYRPVISVSK